MNCRRPNAGFTLIELVVALFILSLVLSGAIYSIQQYADERLMMKDRLYSHNVAWNLLMKRSQVSQNGTVKNRKMELKSN